MPQNLSVKVEVKTLDYDTADKELKKIYADDTTKLTKIRNLVASYGVTEFNKVPQEKLPELLEKARQL